MFVIKARVSPIYKTFLANYSFHNGIAIFATLATYFEKT